MAGIKHKTQTSELAPGGKIGAAEWDGEAHDVETLDLVGQTSDPVSPADGQAWYRSDLGLWRICSGGRVSDLAPVGQEVALSGDVTLTAADNGKTYTLTANRTITLPTSPVVGYAVSISCNTTSTATLVAGAATVDRDLYVYPTEWALLVWTGVTWRRIMRRGFGINNAGAMGLLSDLRSTVHPSGLWIVNSTTANISARPSHMDTSAVVRIERRDASQLSMTMWSLTHGQGSWRATYAAGTWSAWSNGGSIAALPTASLPTNVATGAEVFDTDRDRMVVWDGALVAWIDASDRARHTGTQLAATISDFATAADARVAAGITGKADLAHTHAFADLTAKPTTIAGYGITDALEKRPRGFLLPTSGEWIYTAAGFVLGSNNTLSNNSHVQYIWTPDVDFTASDVAINVVTAGAAGSLAKITIYDTDADGKPNALLLTTGTMDCASTGVKTVACAQSFTGGRQYVIGVRASTTTTFAVSGWDRPVVPIINGGASPVVSTRNTISRSATFASDTQDPWVWSPSEISSGTAPYMAFKRA